MRQHLLSLLAAGLFASPAFAQTYTSPGAFFGAAGSPSYVETFETVPIAKDASVASFSQAGITYSGQAGTNVFVSSPGYVNYGAGLNPTTTSILTANGDENFLIQFLSPYYAVGFDVYYNGLGPATASFFNGSTLLGSVFYNGTAFLGFNGFIASASTPVTSVEFISTLGGVLNTGVDNLAVINAPTTTTPEPATLVLFATGLAGLALARRRRA
jgi:PEP-CTERM motif